MTTFHITNTERFAESGLIKKIHWFAVKEQGETKAFEFGMVDLPEKEATDSTFINYEDVGMETAIEWLKKELGQEKIQLIEQKLDVEIQTKILENQTNGVPWLFNS